MTNIRILQLFSLGHIIKTPICYMGTNPSSIDHIIATMTSLFMKFCTVETRISDYQKLMSICRMTFAKGKSKKLFYRCLGRSVLSKVLKPLLA